MIFIFYLFFLNAEYERVDQKSAFAVYATRSIFFIKIVYYYYCDYERNKLNRRTQYARSRSRSKCRLPKVYTNETTVKKKKIS